MKILKSGFIALGLLALPLVATFVIFIVVAIFTLTLGTREVPVSEIQKEMKIVKVPHYPPEKENASKESIKLLTEDFYWHISDDNCPFNRNNGEDSAIAFYRWRETHKTASTAEFIPVLLAEWNANLVDWTNYKHQAITGPVAFLAGPSIYRADEVIISVAFAQLIAEGKIDPDLRDMAIKSVDNEACSEMIKYRKWHAPELRVKSLNAMKRALNSLDLRP